MLKNKALVAALHLLQEARHTGFMAAATMHQRAAHTLSPWAGCGRVGYACELILAGKTRSAIHMVRYALQATL